MSRNHADYTFANCFATLCSARDLLIVFLHMETPNKMTATWKPETLEEIAGKAHLYKTARITATGECVSVLSYRDGTFIVRGSFGIGERGWRELDSFVL